MFGDGGFGGFGDGGMDTTTETSVRGDGDVEDFGVGGVFLELGLFEDDCGINGNWNDKQSARFEQQAV